MDSTVNESPVTLIAATVDQMNTVAARLASLLRAGDVLCLTGDLGAGKTTFTRGLVAALGAPARLVTSPTFTLLHEYRDGRLPVWHADAYRLARPEDAEHIGLNDILATGEGVTIIEWWQRIAQALPAERLEITFTETENENRTVTFITHGPRWADFETDWQKAVA